MLSSAFHPTGTYLDSATYGLAPDTALAQLMAVTAQWAAGTYDPLACDEAVASARATFARLHKVDTSDVAIGHQVSPLVSMVAGGLAGRPGRGWAGEGRGWAGNDRALAGDGGGRAGEGGEGSGRAVGRGPGPRVLVAEGDFTSLLFPFLAVGCTLLTQPLERLAEAVDAGTDVVAVSAVQSADGRLADLEAIVQAAQANSALTVVDATQACGWLPLDASRFDVLIAGGYKWLCHPRGTAFMVIRPSARERLAPVSAGWYAGEDPWETCYGTPLRLAADARRFDVSPAWLSWHAAAAALELLEATGSAPGSALPSPIRRSSHSPPTQALVSVCRRRG
jgi:selenocysteine lyase/cysteine desulfurase